MNREARRVFPYRFSLVQYLWIGVETITTRWCRRLEIQTPFLNINLFRFSPVAPEICYLFATRGGRLNILSTRTGCIHGLSYFRAFILGRGRISSDNWKNGCTGGKGVHGLSFRALFLEFVLFEEWELRRGIELRTRIPVLRLKTRLIFNSQRYRNVILLFKMLFKILISNYKLFYL